ncbi:MAG: threonine synthase, partial [candidate division Zixibacteria bacterium]|nr:threonine synthase [candidate division Zixibacteria bacterium]
MPFLTHLECSACGQQYSHTEVQNLCACGKPLLARYNLKKISESVTPRDFQSRPADMWRYRELLPDLNQNEIISLGEG